VTDWPFGTDADQHDPLTGMRIPVVGSMHPRYMYFVAVLVNEKETAPWLGYRPDDREAAQVAAYLGYLLRNYSGSALDRLRERPLDAEAGRNTVILWKRAPGGDWCYRQASWRDAGEFPVRGAGWSLEQVLDHLHEGLLTPQWEQWKARHRLAFGPGDAPAAAAGRQAARPHAPGTGATATPRPGQATGHRATR
jgi:hypothetical protein